MSTERIKERIRKLLAVAADNAAANQEIETALRVANQLMLAHHLSEADLLTEPSSQYADIEQAEQGKIFVPIGGKIFAWEAVLMQFVIRFVGGVSVYTEAKKRLYRINGIAQTKNGQPVEVRHAVFYGIVEDIQIAADIYIELRQAIIALAQLKFASCYKGDGGAYCEGFVSGLFTKLAKEKEHARIRALFEQQANQSSTALILIDRQQDLIERKTKLAETYLKSTGTKLRKTYKSGASGSSDARNEGKADGQAYSITASRKPKLN